MKNKKWRKAIFCTAAMVISHPTPADVINFEDLASQYELTGVGPTYSTQGYTFAYTAAPGEPYPTGLFSVGQSWRYNPGSTALFANSDGATTTLMHDSGQPYSLISIDLAELNGPGASSVLFEGIRSSGQHVMQTFYLDGLTGFEHFNFSSDFYGITSVSWKQGDNVNLMPHMFDNVAVTTSVVPLPGTAILLLSALSVFGIAFRRKASC